MTVSAQGFEHDRLLRFAPAAQRSRPPNHSLAGLVRYRRGLLMTSKDRRWCVPLVLAALAPCVVQLCGKYALDLDVYRAGGWAVLHGQDLYAVRLHRNGFTYPPFAATLFTGLAVLRLGAATLVLTLVSLGCLAMFVRCSARHLLTRPPSVPVLVGLAALVACEPVRATLWTGQIDLVLAALVTRDLLGAGPRRLRGVGIGLAAAVKLTPAIFVVYLLVRRRYRDAACATGAFALATASAWLALPQDSVRFWTNEVFAGSGLGDISQSSNQSLLGVLLRLAPPIAYPVWAVLAAPTVVMGLRIARRASLLGNEVLAVGTVGVTGCLVSPVSWSHHWIWCIPWLVGLAAMAHTRALRWWTISVGAVFFGQYLLPRVLTDAWAPLQLIADNAFLLAAVITLRVTQRLNLPQSREGMHYEESHAEGTQAQGSVLTDDGGRCAIRSSRAE